MKTLKLPKSFVLRNGYTKIEVIPTECTWDQTKEELNIKCDLYWNNISALAYQESFIVPLTFDPHIRQNPLAKNRLIQLQADCLFAHSYQQIIQKYLTAETLPQ